MLAGALLAALTVSLGIAVLLVRRQHPRDDFGPSVRDYAAFRATLAAVDRREQVHV